MWVGVTACDWLVCSTSVLCRLVAFAVGCAYWLFGMLVFVVLCLLWLVRL